MSESRNYKQTLRKVGRAAQGAVGLTLTGAGGTLGYTCFNMDYAPAAIVGLGFSVGLLGAGLGTLIALDENPTGQTPRVRETQTETQE